MGVIYRLTCNESGKIYIGKSKHPARHRWNQHVYESRNPDKASQSRYLNNAIRCYGEDCWVIETLLEEPDDSLLFAWEEVFIALYSSLAQPDGSGGYNLHMVVVKIT